MQPKLYLCHNLALTKTVLAICGRKKHVDMVFTVSLGGLEEHSATVDLAGSCLLHLQQWINRAMKR